MLGFTPSLARITLTSKDLLPTISSTFDHNTNIPRCSHNSSRAKHRPEIGQSPGTPASRREEVVDEIGAAVADGIGQCLNVGSAGVRSNATAVRLPAFRLPRYAGRRIRVAEMPIVRKGRYAPPGALLVESC
jgi:hypothetical protein